jgi:hypothetical protein
MPRQNPLRLSIYGFFLNEGQGGKGKGRGKGGEVTQTLYAHMNKIKILKKTYK